MSTFSQTLIASTIAACIGKRLALEDMREIALEHGAAGFREFMELCRLAFVARGVHNVKRESFAYMQKDKCPGVSTFYTYAQKILRLAEGIDAGKAGAMDELLGLTTGKLTQGKGKAGAKTRTPKAEGAAPAPLTVDDAVAFLQAAHKAGALTAAHYAALQALTMAPARSNVVDMGAAIEVPRELLAA